MKINKDVSSYIPPFTIVLIDAKDAYYYADLMGQWEEIVALDDLNKAIDIADAFFVIKNYKWDSLEEMNSFDSGFDVRIYDKVGSCVYAAHKSFKDHWIGCRHVVSEDQNKPSAFQQLLTDALEEAQEGTPTDNNPSNPTDSDDVSIHYFDDQGFLSEKVLPNSELKRLIADREAQLICKVFIKGFWEGVREQYWELDAETINKFADENGHIYSICAYEKGEPKYYFVKWKIWDKTEELEKLVEDSHLSEDQRFIAAMKLVESGD